MEQDKRKPGRPPGTGQKRFEHTRSYKLGEQDLRDIGDLAALWHTSEAEAVRRAVRETVRRERRKGAE